MPLAHLCESRRQPSLRTRSGSSEPCRSIAHKAIFSLARALDAGSSPRGYRILAKIPRLPATVVDRIVSEFGRLPKVISASTDDLLAVEGVGAARATLVKDGLIRLAESSILERYL